MLVQQRIDRFRSALVSRGERRPSAISASSAAAHHTDFSDFSEKTGPGDREPNFNDFVDRN